MGLLSKLKRGRGKVKFSDNFFYNPRREKLRTFFDKKIQADLAKAKERGGFAGAIPMPISGRMGRINRLFGDMQFRDPILAAEQEMADRGMIGRGFQDFSIRSGRGFRPGGDGQLIPIKGQEPRFGFGLGELLPRIKDKVPLAPVFAGMPIPQMVGQPQMLPQPIPRVPVEENISEISDSGFGMPDPRMNMMEPRMMMADGEEADITDFLNASPQMRLSGIDARLGELQREFDQAQINGDIPRQTMLNEQINETIKERVNVMGMIGDMQRQADMKMAAGGEAKPDFLDFDKDGNKEESMKDALKDRDGFAVGGLSAAARSLNAPRNLARAAALTAAAGYGAGKVMEGPISQALESFTPENLGAFVAQGKLTFRF